jgi:hypothetical protein
MFHLAGQGFGNCRKIYPSEYKEQGRGNSWICWDQLSPAYFSGAFIWLAVEN